MSTNSFLFQHNLSNDFALDVLAKKIIANVDGTTVVRDSVSGKLKVDVTALAIGASTDAGNLLVSGTDGKLKLTAAAIQNVVVPSTDADNALLAGSDGKLLLTSISIKSITAPSADTGNLITVDGSGRHYIDVETIQDAIGLAIAEGTGVTYDDALDRVNTALGNLTFESTDSINVVFDTSVPGSSAVTTSVKIDSTAVGNLLKVIVGQGLAVTPSDVWAVIEPAITYTSMEVDKVTDPLNPVLKCTITVNGVAKTASVGMVELTDTFSEGQGMYVVVI